LLGVGWGAEAAALLVVEDFAELGGDAFLE
jgi:hypothetical protein